MHHNLFIIRLCDPFNNYFRFLQKITRFYIYLNKTGVCDKKTKKFIENKLTNKYTV